MTPETAVVQALNGISFGALLFILAAGLSLVFGMMDVVNLAHGSFYIARAYITLTVVQRTGQFWLRWCSPRCSSACSVWSWSLCCCGACAVVTSIQVLVHDRRVPCDRRPDRPDPRREIARSIPGRARPRHHDHGRDYPVYRLFVIAFGVALALASR